MTIQAKLLGAIAVSGFAALAVTSPAQALTAQECSAKYQAAKKAGTLGTRSGMISARPSAAPTPRRAGGRRCRRSGPAAEPKEAAKKRRRKRQGSCGACRPAGPAVFPNAVDPKYSKESAGKARMHTCVDQYNANKTSQRQWRHEVDPEGRRLLQRMHQEAEGRRLTATDKGAAGCFGRAYKSRSNVSADFATSCARLRGPRSRNSRLWPNTKQ